jgi:hypothetical protein
MSPSFFGLNPNIKIWFHIIVAEAAWREWDACVRDVQISKSNMLTFSKCIFHENFHAQVINRFIKVSDTFPAVFFRLKENKPIPVTDRGGL